jgi:soluble lytic murein transglycosylase-like protein
MWEMKALKFIYASEKACRLYPIIDQAARRHEVETHLIMAIIYAESRYDPTAVSHRGARGLMQLMPRTAKSLGVADILDPAQNVEAGVRYFKWLLELLDGDQKLALAAYNAGLSNVRQHNGVPPFSATRSYIEIVSSLYERYKRREMTLSAPPEVSSLVPVTW